MDIGWRTLYVVLTDGSGGSEQWQLGAQLSKWCSWLSGNGRLLLPKQSECAVAVVSRSCRGYHAPQCLRGHGGSVLGTRRCEHPFDQRFLTNGSATGIHRSAGFADQVVQAVHRPMGSCRRSVVPVHLRRKQRRGRGPLGSRNACRRLWLP